MLSTTFLRLHGIIGNRRELDTAYGNVLKEICEVPLWEGGEIGLRRVLWTAGRRARSEDPLTFQSPGLYLWGAENRPLYIGITRSAFLKRFSRYIWQARSQCNLARDFEGSLVSKGIQGFPPEILEWYAKWSHGSTVRLQGAVRFAEEGIDGIWFTLFPHGDPAQIEELESKLVPVAAAWNCNNGFRPLLNIEFNRRHRANRIPVKRKAPQGDSQSRAAPESLGTLRKANMLPSDPITNARLTPKDIPLSDAGWSEIQQFALTFDGYEVHRSFDACARIANERRSQTLTDLRTCLFFEQRRWRHFSEDPEGEDLECIRRLVDRIRAKVEAGELD